MFFLIYFRQKLTGNKLTDSEILEFSMLFLAAGNETTTNFKIWGITLYKAAATDSHDFISLFPLLI